MKLRGYDDSGKSQALPSPTYAKLEHTLYGASAFSATVPISESAPDFSRVRVYDGDTLLFHGPVDRQSLSVGEQGRQLSLSARDYSALLLDNEAKPTRFTFCRLSDLFEAFVYRHGITNGIYKNPYYAPFDVHKGYSEFEALERFCRLTDLGRPYVDETKTLQVHELSGKEQAVFSPQGWTPLSAQRVLNRHKPLDEVVLMQRDTLQYSQTIANKSGLAGNISRRRYKKLFAYTDWQAQNEARRILAESRGGSREYTVTLAGLQRIAIGTGASVAAFGIAAAGLTVVKTALICSEDGIYTTVTLWPREDVY